MDADRVRSRRTRLALCVFTGAYLVFVIYGSLVPLDFHPLTPEEAWERFRPVAELQFDIGSRADLVANVLLFIPLAFLGLGAIAPRRRAGPGALASGAVWIGCVLLSVAIECAQVYFPPRTTSFHDVVAETLGGSIGIALWWMVAGRTLRALERWRLVRGDSGLAEWLLWPYLLLVAALDLLPLDLSLRPHDLAEKWNAGRIVLLPFTFPVTHPLQRLYEPILESLVWLPVAGLWLLTGRGGPLVAWCVTILVATTVELGQLLVFSRISDVTDIVCAAAGAGAGVWLATRLRDRLPAGARIALTGRPAAGALATPRARTALLAAVVGIAWSIAILVASWYPFDFHTQSSMLRARLHTMRAAPFASYYFGSALGTFSELTRRLLLFAPLGACLAVVCHGARRSMARARCTFLSLGLVAVATVVIGLGQMFLGSKYPSFSDAVIEWCGGAVGFWAAVTIHAWLSARRSTPPAVG